mmetsp:Transcript_35178/g.63306  ORF Transcript_35178/g.63306 Transcript_35178/m.63306 type:complete len:152 (+) Transcript_35178:401-856(+)
MKASPLQFEGRQRGKATTPLPPLTQRRSGIIIIMARTASDRAALMSESPGNDGETPAAATAKTAPLPIRKRQPMARAMARQLKPPITILPAMQLPREMKQHRSRRHPCKIFDDSSQTTSSAAAPMRHSSMCHHQPIVSRGSYATSSAAAST